MTGFEQTGAEDQTYDYSALAAQAMDRVPDPEELEIYIDALERLRMDLTRGTADSLPRYDEADACRLRIEELRKAEEARRAQSLRDQQQEELENIMDAHRTEMEEFNAAWSVKEQEFAEHSQRLQDMLAERQVQEYAAQLDKLKIEAQPMRPKWSRDLLNLRKIQDGLGKQKKYEEAQRMQITATALEAKELAAWEQARNVKIAKFMEQHSEKQRLEMKGLVKRIKSGEDEQCQAKLQEEKRLVQRFQNTKRQQTTQHKITHQRIQKYASLTGSSVLGSQVLIGLRPASGNGQQLAGAQFSPRVQPALTPES